MIEHIKKIIVYHEETVIAVIILLTLLITSSFLYNYFLKPIYNIATVYDLKSKINITIIDEKTFDEVEKKIIEKNQTPLNDLPVISPF